MNFPNLRSLFRKPKIAADTTLSSNVSFNGYDAAQTSSARSTFFGFPMLVRQEMNAFTRREILRKVRALEANLGLFSRMKTQVGKYAVGFGLFPQPATKDDAWNKEARERFHDWGNNPGVCDAAGAMTFWERQRFHAETFFSEGESWDALVSSSVSGFPQLQLFDNSEIGHVYGNYAEPDGRQWIDGVQVNDQNRPVSYLVSQQSGQLYNLYTTSVVNAGDMIHLIRRKRAGQLRAISPFAPGINSAIDQLDIKALTTAAAKLHEALGIVVKKESGEAGKTGVTNQINRILDGDGNLSRIDEKFLAGAGIQYLNLDEEIQVVGSNRPTQNLVNWYVELVRDVCLGTGLNFEIVFSLMDLGGATARIALADAQWFFDSVQDLLNDRFNQRVWVWWAASMMKNGQLSNCKDPRWWNCAWQGPPKLTADAGRAIQGDVLALQNGMLTWEDYHNQRGANYQDKIGKQIAALKWAMDECKKDGVPFEYIYALKPGTPQTGPGFAGQAQEGGAVATLPEQTINLSIDNKPLALRKTFTINRPDGSVIEGEMKEALDA